MLTRGYMMLGDLKQHNIDAHKMLHDAWGPKQPNIDAHNMLYDDWGPKTAQYWCSQYVI